VANTVDPLAGSYAIEALTNEIEAGARALLDRIEAAGGTLAAIEQGLIQRAIQESAYRAQQQIDAGERAVVGVNTLATEGSASIDVMSIDPEIERRQVDRVRAVRTSRDAGAWRAALDQVIAAARGSDNLVPPIVQAVEARATVGEIADAMRSVFGEHKEVDV
jgi:methylmalonyl-CoA mutase N-terminal domain/subunit